MSESSRAALDWVNSTSTADAPTEKCPHCGGEEVFWIISSKQPLMKACDDCEETWLQP